MIDTENSESAEVPVIAPKKWWKRIRRAAVLYLFIPYFSITVLFVALQRKLMYQPSVIENSQIESVHLDRDNISDVQIQTPDGISLNGWLLKQTKFDNKHDSPLVIYFPGNSLNRYQRINDLTEIASCGFDVLIFDYRGYGDNAGSPSEQKLTADAKLVWNYARRQLNYDESRIVIFGGWIQF